MNGMAGHMGQETARRAGNDDRDSPWLYALLALLGTAGFFYVNLAAAIVDGLTGTLGFTSAQAGGVMSANIYGASVGGLIAVFMVRRFPWRPVLVGLLCVLLALELASLLAHSYRVLLPLRALDGVIGGMSVGVALALLARTRFPDRAFGALLACGCPAWSRNTERGCCSCAWPRWISPRSSRRFSCACAMTGTQRPS